MANLLSKPAQEPKTLDEALKMGGTVSTVPQPTNNFLTTMGKKNDPLTTSQTALAQSQKIVDGIFTSPLQDIAAGNADVGFDRFKGSLKQIGRDISSVGAQNAGPVGAKLMADAKAKGGGAAKFAQAIEGLDTALQPTNRGEQQGMSDTGIASMLIPGKVIANSIREIPLLSKFLAKRAADKEVEQTIKALKPKMTPTEIKDAAAAGMLEKGGIFKSPQVDFTKDAGFMKSVDATKGIVRGKSAIEDVNAVRDALSKEAENLKASVSAVDHPYTFKELASKLSSVEEPISLRGTPFEKQIGPIKQAAIDIAKSKGGNVSGLLDARKEFDALVEKTYPNLYEAENAPMRNAITAIRRAMNDFIEENLPEGSGFRESLQKQKSFYDAIDNMTTKIPDEVKSGNLFKKLLKNPFLQTAVGAGAGATLINKVTND